MKKLIILFFIFTIQANAKPKYPQDITTLSKDHSFFRKELAPDFWALIAHYRPQMSGHSCSIASGNIIFNALNAKKNLTSDDKLTTEVSSLELIKDTKWKNNVSDTGKGMTLEELRSSMASALVAMGYSKATVNAFYASDTDFRKQLINNLKKNETTDQDFMIINYDQGYVMKDEPAGHISPVGAYDSKAEKILMLDTDRDWYEPYWVPVDTLIQAMNTEDKVSQKTRGYIKINLN